MSFSSDDFAKALEQHSFSFQRGDVVRGTVHSHDTDGLYVDIGGKAAAYLPRDEAALKRLTDISTVLPIGEERDFLIIREQNSEGQVTLSIRQLEIKQLWQQFEEMQGTEETIDVRVSGVNKGGVTVDAQGLRGFVPRSHLIERDSLDSLVGNFLTVSLLEVDPERRRLVLSQRLASQAASLTQLEVGQLISGRISGIKPFGVFVDFDGVTGLLHINQVSKNYVSSLDAIFQTGQSVKAMIIALDEVKRRVSLSIKVLENYPGEVLEKMETVMSEAADRADKARTAILKGEASGGGSGKKSGGSEKPSEPSKEDSPAPTSNSEENESDSSSPGEAAVDSPGVDSPSPAEASPEAAKSDEVQAESTTSGTEADSSPESSKKESPEDDSETETSGADVTASAES